MNREIGYRAYHSGQMLEVAAIDFEKNEIRVKGEVSIVHWKKYRQGSYENVDDLIDDIVDVDTGEGTYSSKEVNGTLELNHENLLPVYLMEFTGLKDKHDTKIFESDVLRDGGENLYVMKSGVFDYVIETSFNSVKICGFYADPINDEVLIASVAEGGNFEIIGNIYQHPNLLKGKP